jgi:hypothetical protein
MTIKKQRGPFSLALFLLTVALLAAGCSQPASPSGEKPVGSSLSAPAQAGGAEAGGRESAGPGKPGGGVTAAAEASASPKSGDEGVKAAPGGSAAGDAPGQGAAASAGPGGTGAAPAQAAPGAGAQQPGPSAGAAGASPQAGVTEPTKAPDQPAAADTGAPARKDDAPAALTAKESKPAKGDDGKATSITFKDLYSDMTVRGVNLSDTIKQLDGHKVEMTGFMAPPLTAKVKFFVLTKVALTICPFCSSDADWPTDIVVVYMPKGKNISPTEHQVKVTGTLSVGSRTDDETGFVSLIRIEADKVEVLK